MYEDKKKKQEQQKSSPLINEVNELQAKYQAAIQGLSDEEKEEVRHTELFSELYRALSEYTEHCTEKSIRECGVKTGDLDVQGVKELVWDEVFGLYGGKTPLYESFEPVNDAKFTTFCYSVIENTVKDAIEKERNLLLDLVCLKKPEVKELKDKNNKQKWGLHTIRKRLDSFEETDESIADRIFGDPQKVYEEQCYLQYRIEQLKIHMDIVAEGPETDKRSTTNKPVYFWVGGSVGAYLSPVMEDEWQTLELEKDTVYDTASLIQENVIKVAVRCAAEDLGIKIKQETKDATGVSPIEAAVTEKLTEQMELVLEQKKNAVAGSLKPELRARAGQYYKILSKEYEARVAEDAEFALAWTWQVIFGLTPEEAAWLFVRELNACVSMFKFDWKEPFKERMQEEKYSLPFEKVTSEKTTQVWPKRLRSKVFEIQKTRAGKLKNPLSKERQEELLAEYTQKGEEDAGFGL